MRGTWGNTFRYPVWNAILTFGGYQPPQGNKVGPSGPLPDPRGLALGIGPWFGRAVPPLNAWGPNSSTLYLWPQMPVNNAYATETLAMFVPGWLKPPPSSSSGF